ncbi:MAG: ABC transporter ATP-binding protein [Lachnospiraceae bacterium]|nr:ABC transporter ATP-binding protein [Lachnospiraceae bacterium]
MIKLERISKSYGREPVLDKIDLTLDSGEIYGLIAENGGGKTTLLKIASVISEPDAGKVVIEGVNAARDPYYARRHVGYVPDQFGSYHYMTVREYMEFYASLCGLSGRKAKVVCENILGTMEIEDDHMDREVEKLSKGMRQRLCIARALIPNPDFLVLDEPFDGIDPVGRRQMYKICRNLAEEGKIILVSSHELGDMESLCTRFGFLKNGKIVAEGGIEDLYLQVNLGKVLSVTALSEVDAVLMNDFFRENDLITSVVRDHMVFHITGEFTAEEEADLLTEMINRKIRILEFSHVKNPLEEVFEAVVGGRKDEVVW